jgi:ABC-2 type transport system ATP-binding protein
MNEVIKTENLSKSFGKVQAVESISLNVKKGEIYGFLGLNGAGKTTTIRMLLGMIRPSSGKSWLFGKEVNPGNTAIWEKVGYLVEVPYAWPELTVRENLEIFRKMRFAKEKNAVDTIMDKLKLGQYHDRKAKHLSLGNSQRLGLAKALIHNPEIIILDEPANGLDPAGIVEIRELLHDLAFKKGVTILVSSHLLNEISKFATRIGIINEGRFLMESDIDKLDEQRHRSLHIKTLDQNATTVLLKQKGYPVLNSENGILEIGGTEAINRPENVAKLLVESDLAPSLLKVEEEDLEAFFLRTIKNRGEK